MNNAHDLFVRSGVRTAIGKYGGGRAGVPPGDLAAAGTIPAVRALCELRRSGGRYGLVTRRIGGGQGIAAIFERA